MRVEHVFCVIKFTITSFSSTRICYLPGHDVEILPIIVEVPVN